MTSWFLKDGDGRYLCVEMDFSVTPAHARYWLDDHRALSPCFETAERASRYAERFAPGYEVQPVCEHAEVRP